MIALERVAAHIPPMPRITPTFFPTPADFRRWLAKNHNTAPELWVGFHKTSTGKPSITWPESVAEALCYGWIDGIRKTVNADSYMIRFTPRHKRSNWSAVNIRTVERLIAERRMKPAGLTAFKARDESKSEVYSFENRKELDPAYVKKIRANRKAWAFFESQPPGYRRTAGHWVMSAKREATRLKRLATLIDDSARGERIGPLRRGK